jgi:hypothetical protein
MKRLALTGALAAAVLAGLPTESRAGAAVSLRVVVASHDERGSWRHAEPAWRHGFDRGFRDGSERGHKDARHARDFDYRRHSEFRHADSGYKRWMGPRFEYGRGYRDGFAAGYRRAYLAARPGGHDRSRTRYEAERRRGDGYRR